MPDPISPLGTPRVLVAAPENPRHAHLAWPKLALTSNGVLILVYSAGEFHGAHREGCPAVSVSSDNGTTFSDPQILAEFGEGENYTHCGNLAIGTTTDNAIILIAMAYRGDEANSIFCWVSIDAGQTWQDINVAALAAGRTGSVYGHIFSVPGRGYAVCGHFRAGSYPNDSGLWISFSQDGLHWGAPEQISDESLVEPDDPDRVIAPVTERSIPNKTPSRISIWTSSSLGLEWSEHGTVIEFPHEKGSANTDFGYPWMVKCEDGKWLIAFYFGQQKGPNAIWGLDFELGP